MNGDDKLSEKESSYSWQIIIIQVKTESPRSHSKVLPLQTTISYGDQKEATPVVKAKDPLWNFWTQLPDKGGTEEMGFSLLARDDVNGKTTLKGETWLDMSKYRRVGESFELWEPLHKTRGRNGPGPGPGALSAASDLLHLTVTYCPVNFGGMEDVDCQLCTHLGVAGCSIS